MNWPSEEWTLGGYSHTCYKFVGYMEGALNSGVSIARRLAVRDGVAKG
jgi:hypothetical protein